MKASLIAQVHVRPLNAAMNEPFTIATATRTRVQNVLISVHLADGAIGHGECAPFSAFSRETQDSALASAKRAAQSLEGMDAAAFLPISRRIEELLTGQASVRAGLEMAVLDAWARQRKLPLWIYFGGAGCRLRTDVTITLVPPNEAVKRARSLLRRGIRTIKVKVGRDLAEDLARVQAVARAAPKTALIVDANQGYTAIQALRFLRELARVRIRPALFEQPVPRDDWEGLAKVAKDGNIPVAADESVSSLSDAWRMARKRAAQVVNIKLMKYGIREALEVARVCRSAGLGLMIGGMVESRLAMGCAAHLAAGFGGFDFVDLDTPLWFAADPMAGLRIGPGGLYDLGRVRYGIGVRPKSSLR